MRACREWRRTKKGVHVVSSLSSQQKNKSDAERKAVSELKKAGFEIISSVSPSCRAVPGQIIVGSVLLKYVKYCPESESRPAISEALGKNSPLGESIRRSIYADEKGFPYC